jgi:hypothetical protein
MSRCNVNGRMNLKSQDDRIDEHDAASDFDS